MKTFRVRISMFRLLAYAVLVLPILIGGCALDPNWPLVERFTVTEGDYRGIRIGDSKSAVIAALKRLGVTQARVVPSAHFNISLANAHELPVVEHSEGIGVMDFHGVAFNLIFEHGVVTDLYKSVPARNLEWFYVGESVPDVISQLRQLLREHEGLVVLPLVRAHGLPPTNTAFFASDWDVSQLVRYNHWQVELNDERPRGAFLELTFYERLARIDYLRSRLPLE